MDGVSRVLSRIYEIQSRIDEITHQYSPEGFSKKFYRLLGRNIEASKSLKKPLEVQSKGIESRKISAYLNRWAISRHPEKAIEEVPFAFRKKVVEAARKYNLPVELIVSVMKAESSFNPYAVSSKGAIGLMQLMPETAKQLGVEPFDPYENIEGGVRYLRYLIDRYDGDLPLALAAYNAGPERVTDRVPPIDETQDYVLKVMEFLNDYIKEEK